MLLVFSSSHVLLGFRDVKVGTVTSAGGLHRVSIFVYVYKRPFHSQNVLSKCRLQRNCGSSRIAGSRNDCLTFDVRNVSANVRKWKKIFLFSFFLELYALASSTSGEIICEHKLYLMVARLDSPTNGFKGLSDTYPSHHRGAIINHQFWSSKRKAKQ